MTAESSKSLAKGRMLSFEIMLLIKSLIAFGNFPQVGCLGIAIKVTFLIISVEFFP